MELALMDIAIIVMKKIVIIADIIADMVEKTTLALLIVLHADKDVLKEPIAMLLKLMVVELIF